MTIAAVSAANRRPPLDRRANLLSLDEASCVMRVRVEGGTRDQQFILTLSICGCFISSELGAVVSEDERPAPPFSSMWREKGGGFEPVERPDRSARLGAGMNKTLATASL